MRKLLFNKEIDSWGKLMRTFCAKMRPKAFVTVTLLLSLAGSIHAGEGPDKKPIGEEFPWAENPFQEITNLPHYVTAITFSPKEDLLAYSMGGQIHFWDLAKKEHLPAKIEFADRQIYKIDISDNGRFLLAAAKGQSTSHLILWDFASKKKIWECTDFKHLNNAGFFPGSKKIAATDFEQLKMFDVQSNQPVKAFSIDPGFVSFLDFSKDGKRVYVAGNAYGKFQVFDLDAKEPKSTVHCEGYGISAIQVLKEKEAVILAGNQSILLFRENRMSKIFRPMNRGVRSLAASPDDGRIAICEERQFSIWNINQEKEYLLWNGDSKPKRWPYLTCFSPQGTYCAMAHSYTIISIWKR
jgi:WD40 repeat protein